MQHVFLICSERCGSNLITRLFDAHPRVCGPPPTHLVRLLAGHADRWGDLHHDDAWERLLTAAVDLLDTALVPGRVEWTRDALRRAVPVRTLASLVRTVLEAEARAHGADVLLTKENRLHRVLPFVLHAFPEARFLALVRDPRDMALSWSRSAVLRGDVARAARVWREDQEALLALMGQMPRAIHLLTYEALTADPAAVLADACVFLGLEPDAAMLDFHRGAAARGAAAGSSAWRNLARPILADNTGKWRTDLDADQIAFVEHACGPVMEAYGYAPERTPPADAEALTARMTARERHDKPEYADVPAAERALRARRAAVERRLADLPLPPVLTPLAAPAAGGR
ncbi:MAG TPA: sulfotransferase [Candidatus Krumholzibacteria bacterium]|nr:sulfotransferase [Candidatus Krumholzibacteria bacterium]